jgi:putative hydrolase of the HAD superfamily
VKRRCCDANPEQASKETHVIERIGFDADDTLWHSEGYYQQAQAEFEQVLGGYVDLADAGVHQRLLATERSNLALFGYGAKGMTLSMLETAIALSDERISAGDLHRIVTLGKQVLQHPVELLPGIRAAVEAVAADYPIVLITKGDLFHQEAKIAASGLADLFTRIEIVSEKNPAAYERVIHECGTLASRFVMIGNSLRSDIAPVLELGGWAVHVPYRLTWAHELEHEVDSAHPRLLSVDSADQIRAAIATLEQRANA